MLLSEELALAAMDPGSGRHALGTRDALNACLAGLLVAELMLEGALAPGRDERSVVATDVVPAAPALAAAAQMVIERGPRIKAVLSAMSRGLEHQLGTGTWDTAVAGLVEAGVLAPAEGGLRLRHRLLDPAARDAVVARLQSDAADDGPLEPRTALLLSMSGPAHLLEVVAPRRAGRRHARRRIDHALDRTDLKGIAKTVRQVIAEAHATAGGAAVIVSTASS